jgi:hypothetical protein
MFSMSFAACYSALALLARLQAEQYFISPFTAKFLKQF